MSDKLMSKIKALEEKVRFLEIENSIGADRAEDIFLFATTAESISKLTNEKEIFETVLEKISIMKNIPYCAFGTMGNGEVNLEYEYASFSEDEKAAKIVFSPSLKDEVINKKTVVKKYDKLYAEIDIKFENNNFIPKNILVISFTNLRNRDGLFICIDKNNDDHLDTIRDTLQHSVTLVNNRLDNLYLMDQLSGKNINLEMRIAESMGELEEEIKEHIRTEKALLKSEKMYRTLFEKSNDAIYIVDKKTGRYLNCNAATEKLTGRTLNEIKKLTVYDITPQNVENRMNRIFSEKNAIDFGEVIYVRPDGSERTALLSSVPFDEKNVFGIARDITKRKNVEEALRNSEDKMKSIFRVAPTGIGVVKDRVLVEVNPRICEMIGYTKEELIGKKSIILYPSEAEYEFVGKEKYRQMRKHGTGVVETHWRKKDGSIIDVLLASTPIDINDFSKGVTFTALDITERKRIEEALKQSEEKYRLFLENNDAVILMINPKTCKIIFANNSAIKFYGYEKDVLIGMNLNNINILSPEEIKEKVKEALKYKQNYFVFKHILANGEIRDVEVYQTTFVLNSEPIFSIIIHDISERRVVEENLIKFKLGIEYSTEAIFITKVDGTITYINPAFEKMYGYSCSETIGKTPSLLKSGLLPKDIYEKFWKKLLNKETVEGEIINKRKDDKIIVIEGSNSPIINDNNEIIGFLGIHRDITQRKEEDTELHGAKEKAEKADKMKSIFLAQMSHEIRTPINALVSMSSLLRYDFQECANEDQLMSFDIIDRAGGRIIRTVDLLLNLSEIQAGTYEINLTKFDIFTEVISQIVAENKMLAKNKNIDFNLIYSVQSSELVADHYTVAQIFAQLVDNAIKYTEEGAVSIKVDRNQLEQLVVEIKDTGIGIEEDYLPKIFEPFSQEEMGYSRKYEGNGIGLTLVKTYCKLNNAVIEVESRKGKGSTFRVVFN